MSEPDDRVCGSMSADSIEAHCVAHVPVEATGRFAAGARFGEWRITAFIGRGGNGEVYCAEHVTLGSPAAVKVLVREDARAKVRFEREAKLLAGLKSSAFPRFFSYGEANGTAYIAMELLEPEDLPTDVRNVAHFMLKVCDAVGELHAQGLIHRDIKPVNILWRRDRDGTLPEPVLADLGLVKKTDPSSSDTLRLPNSQTTLGGVGTPGYGAPEQMERGEATAASDIHALGVLADQCFGGNPPRVWKRIIERATSSIPAHRYQSTSAFARAIRCRHWLRYALTVSICMIALYATWIIIRPEPSTSATLQAIPRSPPQIQTAPAPTNKPFPSIMRLDGKTVVLSEPITLEADKEYQISGPGTLDADLFCPTATVVRLKNCVLHNRTKHLYPENGIQYRLENGVYLNFINIRRKPLDLNVRDFTGIYDGAFNEVRFGGPETIEELSELRDDELNFQMTPRTRAKRNY